MKAYWKQQKYLAKYGQFGMGGMGGTEYGMGGAGGYYSNDMDLDENVMGLIHPYSEGDDYQHQTRVQDPQYIKDYGHDFAVL